MPEPTAPGAPDGTEAARARLGAAQYALLAALTAGAPDPDGFDPARLCVQRDVLAAKRADVIAKIAPQLPETLGDSYRRLALAHTRSRPLTGGYRQDAAAFVRALLTDGGPGGGDPVRHDPVLLDPAVRDRLVRWLGEDPGTIPTPPGRFARLRRGTRSQRKAR